MASESVGVRQTFNLWGRVFQALGLSASAFHVVVVVLDDDDDDDAIVVVVVDVVVVVLIVCTY